MNRIAAITICVLILSGGIASAHAKFPEWLGSDAYATYYVKSTTPPGSREFEITWRVARLNDTFATIEQETRLLSAWDVAGPLPRTYLTDHYVINLENRDTYVRVRKDESLSYIGKTEFWIIPNPGKDEEVKIFKDSFKLIGLQDLPVNQKTFETYRLEQDVPFAVRTYWYHRSLGLLMKYEVRTKYELEDGRIFWREDVGELKTSNVLDTPFIPSSLVTLIGVAVAGSIVATIIFLFRRRKAQPPPIVEAPPEASPI